LVTGDSELLREALQALQSALQVYSRTETPQKWADTMHDLAQVLQIYGDQMKSPDVLKKAIETCDSILQVYSQERTPLSWAKTKNTLGAALFLFDRHKGGNEHLDEAQAAIEEALGVFHAHGAKGPAKVAERNLAHIQRLKGQRKNHTIIDPDWSNETP
jgi:tetratricopeptide (TPR) repeat protein